MHEEQLKQLDVGDDRRPQVAGPALEPVAGREARERLVDAVADVDEDAERHDVADQGLHPRREELRDDHDDQPRLQRRRGVPGRRASDEVRPDDRARDLRRGG